MDSNVTRRSAMQLAGALAALPATASQANNLEIGRMPFTPKFVDLVRNFTTVQGTGPVALGAAISGYTGIAEALSTGEQFYYCLQSIDKPQEREVGRGTMLADGRVAREAIGGGLTSFTGGTKTIALVAAAEWFETVGAGGSSGSASVASRASLAAAAGSAALLLAEARREGMFAFDGADLSAKVAADSAQGIYVAPASDPTGASGAWVRRFSGAVDPAWFGLAEANGGAANSAAIAAMLATLKARAANVATNYQGLETIRFPAGDFDLAATIELVDGTGIVEGCSMGFPAGHSTKLNFPAGVTGIRVHAYNTSGATGPADSPAHRGGQSIIRNLALIGAYVGTESEAHGIQLRGQARIENVHIQSFQGDGIHANATVGSATSEGNANLSSIVHSRIQNCRNGIYFNGADSNACTVIGVDCSGNREWGFKDSSFLGNSYIGCHTASNGTSQDGSPSACVSHGGHRYGVIAGQEAGASVNAPSGTTAANAYWYYHSVGGPHSNFPAWSSGNAYRAGGGYFSDGLNAQNVLCGCYAEGDQGKLQLEEPTLVLGGNISNDVYQGALTCATSPGGLKSMLDFNVGRDLRVAGTADVTGQLNATGVNFGGGNLAGTGNADVRGNNNTIGPRGADPAADCNLYLDNTNVSSKLNFRRWSGGTPTVAAQIWTASGQLIIDHTSMIKLRIGAADKAQFTATEFRTTADNSHDLGTPAMRWKSVNCHGLNANGSVVSISPSAGIGYASGAGGAVTQAAAKSAGVTLNRVSGQLTLSDAALAAGASVSFTLTNSTIAATDLVIVGIASGATADSYDIAVTAVAAGSCRIQLRNISAGSLSETLVLNFAVIKATAA